jgi:hypothetical protein
LCDSVKYSLRGLGSRRASRVTPAPVAHRHPVVGQPLAQAKEHALGRVGRLLAQLAVADLGRVDEPGELLGLDVHIEPLKREK